MKTGTLARRWAFYAVDGLRGQPVRRHLRDLEQAFKEPELGLAMARKRARELIEHACSTTAYYRQFQGARELTDFPILQKRTIRKRYDDFLSSAFDRESLVRTSTSGSYGSPLAFLLTRDKKARQSAEIIYFGRWAGYDVGQPHAYVAVTKAKSRLKLLLQNEVLLDPAVLTDEQLETHRQALLESKVPVIIGYESSVRALGEYCRARGDGPGTFSVEGMILMAEPLRESTRTVLHEVFGCPVLSRYASVETGVLGHECACESVHHLNFASYVVELLSPEGDTPVGPGEVGRVVVTDLFSHAMPLIRYDIGDMAISGEACACGRPGPTLQKIEGRAVEEIRGTNGQRISPYAISIAMRDRAGIIQYQFVQKDARSYEMRLQTLPSFNQEEALARSLLSLLGRDAEIRFSYLDQIPPLPSGKRPYIINEYRRAREEQ